MIPEVPMLSQSSGVVHHENNTSTSFSSWVRLFASRFLVNKIGLGGNKHGNLVFNNDSCTCACPLNTVSML
jgi:hypothetical protein